MPRETFTNPSPPNSPYITSEDAANLAFRYSTIASQPTTIAAGNRLISYPANYVDSQTKTPATFKGDLPEMITAVSSAPRGAGHLVLSCEDSIYSQIDLYRGYSKDYDKYVYVRADLHQREMKRVAEQANELCILSSENGILKEELLELRHILENS